MVATLACNKDSETIIDESELKSELKYASTSASDLATNGAPFTILSAGMHYNHLFLNFSYTGGEKGHEFSVHWDEKIIEEGDKKTLKISISHLTDDDNGTSTIQDSLHISLDKLKIPTSLLKEDNLYFDVINHAQTDNHIIFKNIPIKDDKPTEPVIHYYFETLTVKETPCNQIGAWKNLWLERSHQDSTFNYVFDEINDEVNYTPKLNDKLKVKLQYIPLQDIKNVSDCEFTQKNIVLGIKIEEIEEIN